jgi:hypothetical protein
MNEAGSICRCVDGAYDPSVFRKETLELVLYPGGEQVYVLTRIAVVIDCLRKMFAVFVE